MSKSTYLSELPTSVKAVSLNQFIVGCRRRGGVIDGAREFLEQRYGQAKPKGQAGVIVRKLEKHPDVITHWPSTDRR